MPRFTSVPILAALALLAAAPVRAEPAAPRDPCAYMNHASKAYFACVADQAAARQRADATPPAQPVATTPAPPPKS